MSDPDIYAIRRRARCTQDQFADALGIPANTVRSQQPKAPPAARVMAANALLDRGWGKAAQLVAVDGEVRQLVEVKLNVVQPDLKVLDVATTKLLTNPEKPNDINGSDLSMEQSGQSSDGKDGK
jgi:hypothetical protein